VSGKKAGKRDVLENVLEKPIFNDLSKDSLLEKCVDGLTQNQNECFNGYVWKRIPKDTYTGFDQFKFGIFDAVGVFNIGRKATLRTYERLGTKKGHYTTQGCISQKQGRLYHAEYKSKLTSRVSRKKIRGKKKSKNDKNKAAEGKTYKAGAF